MQRMRRTVTALASATALAAMAVLGTATPGAAAPREEHCVVHVVGRAADGALVTTTPVCAASLTTARSAAGVSAADWVIGQHFDGQNLTGSSFQVVGDSCIGGWLNLPGTWINRVSSTYNGCPLIRHFDGYNLTGTSASTVHPGGNLPAALNNKTNSIQYL